METNAKKKEQMKNKKKKNTKKALEDEGQISKHSDNDNMSMHDELKNTRPSKKAKRANDERNKVPRACDDMNETSESEDVNDQEVDEETDEAQHIAIRKLHFQDGVTQDKNGASRFDDPKKERLTRHLKLQGTHVYGFLESSTDRQHGQRR